ncbi:MAG: transposase [Pseudomonadota bacterium]
MGKHADAPVFFQCCRITYQSKNKKSSKTFPALDWLAQLTTHIPDKREHTVRYYGYYSNKSRGLPPRFRHMITGRNKMPTASTRYLRPRSGISTHFSTWHED